MGTKHTPGPWAVNGIAIDAGVTTVCWMAEPPQYAGDTAKFCDNDKANARLIAAAPDLLAALESILRAHETGNNGAVRGEAILCRSFESKARAAITKAKGE